MVAKAGRETLLVPAGNRTVIPQATA